MRGAGEMKVLEQGEPVLVNQDAVNELNWCPSYTLKEGLGSMLSALQR